MMWGSSQAQLYHMRWFEQHLPRDGSVLVQPYGMKLIGLSIDLEELHSASRALEARVDEALAGNQELQSYVQRLDSGLVDEDQEPLNELNYLTEDDLPSEILSSDVVLRELEKFLRQDQQDLGPNSGSNDPSDSA